jgi:hypothetical protein
MTVGLKGGKPAAGSDIAALEAMLGEPLDAQFRSFVATRDGAEPESNSFPVNGVAHMGGVDEFIAVADVLAERRYIDVIAPRAYPIASSAGGNYVVLDQGQGGAIFFWDHEVEGGLYRIADGFDAFLEMIEPFDASTITPAPGQVQSAWIDPDFLKQFGE